MDIKWENFMKCSICKGPILIEPITGWKKGHNAWPINDGRCCDNCNNMVVTARLTNFVNKRKDVKR